MRSLGRYIYIIYIISFIFMMGMLAHRSWLMQPKLRVLIGGDILKARECVQEDGRLYPSDNVGVLDYSSRAMLTYNRLLKRGEVYCLVPSERFIVDRYIAENSSLEGASLRVLPVARENKLALVMSRNVFNRLQCRVGGEGDLRDWILACAATSGDAQPVRFCMADPNSSSVSWIALAALSRDVRSQGGSFKDLKKSVNVQGDSASVEFYKYLFRGCPDDAVLLVYKHVVDDLKGSETVKRLAVVDPAVKVRILMQPLVVAGYPHDARVYEDAFKRVLRKYGFSDVVSDAGNDGALTGCSRGLPDYGVMSELLKSWNSVQ